MAELKLSLTHYKVLHTIYSLNEKSLFPNQEGVYKILSGKVDPEIYDRPDFPTYGVLISYSSKKICHYVLALSRYGYVKNIFDPKSEELYLTLTPKGVSELLSFLSQRKRDYTRVKRVLKPSIVKIDKK